MLRELGFVLGTTPIYEDNQACIKITQTRMLSERTKAIDIRYHRLRHYVEAKEFEMLYISTDEQMADIMTKAAPRHKQEQFAKRYFKTCRQEMKSMQRD